MCTALAGRVFLVVRGRFTAGCKLLEDALLLRRLLVVEPVRLAASLSDMFDACVFSSSQLRTEDRRLEVLRNDFAIDRRRRTTAAVHYCNSTFS